MRSVLAFISILLIMSGGFIVPLQPPVAVYFLALGALVGLFALVNVPEQREPWRRPRR